MTTEPTQEAEPPPCSAPAFSPAEENELFGSSYPLHTFPVLLQQCQKRTYSLFVNSVGLRPPAFLPAVEEKVKIKLHDEYFFPAPVSSPAPPSADASSLASLPALPASSLSSSALPPFAVAQTDATNGETEAQQTSAKGRNAGDASALALLPSESASTVEAKRQRVAVTCPAVHTPEMSVSELLSELSSRTAASSVPYTAAAGGAPATSAAGPSPSSSKALAALPPSGGEAAAGSAVARKTEGFGGELANLRLKNLPAALRPTWHAPWKLHRVIAGHLGWVTCLAVDPTNEWFATGSNDRLIKIWDLASGTLKLSLTGHVSAIRDIKISSRHPYMFTCGEDNRVKCWDLEQNKVVRDYHGHLSGVYTLALHPQLDILCSGGRDAVVRVWDMRTKHEIYVLSGHQGTIMSLQMQSLEPHIISGSQDKMVRLWDLTSGKCSAVLTNHKKSIRAMAFHPQEYSFVSCAADKIKVWRNPLGQFERNIEGHNSIINCCAIKEDGDSSILIAGTNNGQLHFWDWASGYKFDTIQSRVQPGSLESENGIFCCALDKSETRLLTGECDKTIKVWKPDEEATEESHPLQWKPQRSMKRY
ncbi:Testis cDNA clone: QtsA-14439, similar to human pleiotropic regulator 1 (PRL1homolog, Arabidopsis)(PLRG1),related [Neospora caninum Liverpool]|uniref:Testis cDNA clone: QtsA-14439, similar to human pleiotropic regulator 1 (PRL1homolog, Arabidopsis)(PLRG1),related n=1 Tax=Neospora caninum (strain Liverpool) TaxID=572307 RepID=F0VPW0_NEOCL|nr:Testis cDNA clone: QtsA-14439, similar to human pleiotropic regulator 1 (PRL1homolog, Arabidopsis)(PLRG1),related [Neospora caninum Liverpool]CBZ55757.1 Testis cDNA clone: QtsA-14439, similar to human pleiotropic regulator 1 (PRL1homolog, Arabidopsis)(PLRG1),related [Neospora caninum Liverpool]CEL70500.1 TPA: Testis cDNA clone: QtsA-14439, similar to human pleiotropic regulator 1 (PRL1homolog, Arabidopsis)(PLRG1), related [Neospora caninum Liverpool]|eukprot:XP_003885783.1 Testis cDNA clone: QtsA-14439, similar to human pleiotropic regulator 1 (PRL1homolog, Arabidopsis)(PLRG1),related [Neospora caninum Liverpool]